VTPHAVMQNARQRDRLPFERGVKRFAGDVASSGVEPEAGRAFRVRKDVRALWADQASARLGQQREAVTLHLNYRRLGKDSAAPREDGDESQLSLLRRPAARLDVR
jgi:hypothetical protein